MKNVKKYRIKIRSSTPLIWNVMKEELQDEIKKLKKDEITEWERNRDNWVRKASFDEKENVLIPERWIKGMLINSCQQTKIVPHFAITKNATYTRYFYTIIINNVKSVCKLKDLKGFGAFVGARGKNSSTKVWRVRPTIEKWDTEFEIIDPSGRMLVKELNDILEYGGLFVGIGDNRINNFGRFEIDKIVEVKNE